MHQDTAFVVTTSPLEFAASWIALEDIQPGPESSCTSRAATDCPNTCSAGSTSTGTRSYGDEQLAEWHKSIYARAERLGLEQKRFLPKKGDVLIWSADLAHGGSPVVDPCLLGKAW